MKYISILRGINVGGKRKILMSELREMYKSLGYSNVSSYIQSGNLVFESKELPNTIEKKIEIEIERKFSFDVPVIVRSQNEIQRIFSSNPFIRSPDYDIDRLHYTFLKHLPDNPKLIDINKLNYEPDFFVVEGNGVYIFCHGKSSDSKLTNKLFENKLKTQATSRNCKTMKKINEMLGN